MWFVEKMCRIIPLLYCIPSLYKEVYRGCANVSVKVMSVVDYIIYSRIHIQLFIIYLENAFLRNILGEWH